MKNDILSSVIGECAELTEREGTQEEQFLMFDDDSWVLCIVYVSVSALEVRRDE